MKTENNKQQISRWGNFLKNGAGEGNRTLVSSLENCRSTIELRPLARFGTANLQRLAAGKSYRPHFSCQLAGENQTAALFFLTCRRDWASHSLK
jgi:hypothetical protein